MTEKLTNSLVSLRTLSSRLNKATDEANEVVQAVEKFLNDECSIGIPLSITTHEDDDLDAEIALGYARCNGRFRIVVITRPFDRDENGGSIQDNYGTKQTREP